MTTYEKEVTKALRATELSLIIRVEDGEELEMILHEAARTGEYVLIEIPSYVEGWQRGFASFMYEKYDNIHVCHVGDQA